MIRSEERYDNPQDVFLAAIQQSIAGLWTALPGHVESFDADKVTVTVQLGIQTQVLNPDGTVEQVKPSLLQDVPVLFPRGGGCTLTFPIKQGDECLVIFACRSIDSWWQSGGVQAPSDSRTHARADGFALIGPMSQVNKISDISTDKVQLRSDDGSTYVEMDPQGQIVNVTAPGGMTIDSPNVHFTGQTQFDKDMHCDTTLTADTDVVGGDVSLKTHPTTGVTAGSDLSGPPQPQ